MSDLSDKRLLIIGGTTKAATTSLYFYLQDHPEVCVSSIKETRYFLDPSYPLQSSTRYDGKQNTYGEYYSHCTDEQVLVEATPDYLYSAQTASWLKSLYGDRVQLIFLLREPLSRIESWFNFAKQDGHLPKELSIDAYASSMLQQGEDSGDLVQHQRALEQGRYAHYLQAWYEHFDAKDIHLIFFEDVKSQPLGTMQKVAGLAGIDAGFYEDYALNIKNKTKQLKYPGIHKAYKKLRFVVRNRTHNVPLIHKRLQWLRKTVEPLYMKLNESKGQEKQQFSAGMRQQLVSYYAQDMKQLQQYTSLPAAWQEVHSPNT